MKAKELIKYLKKNPDFEVVASVDMDVGMQDDITGRRVFGHGLREAMVEEHRDTIVLLFNHESTNYEGPVACVPKRVRKKSGSLK